MSWVPSKKRMAQFLLLAFMAGEVSYVAAQVLILRSQGPGARRHRPGTRVAPTTTFRLGIGDQVTVLTRRGTRTFRGPGVFTPNGPLRIVRYGGGGPRSSTGAVRGEDGAAELPRPSDIWHYDVTQSGSACLLPGARLTLWRPDATQAVRVTITPPTGIAQTVQWQAGQASLEWPGNLALVDGGRYEVSWDGATAPVQITPRRLGAIPTDNLDAVASAFLANRCQAQLNTLISTRSDPQDLGEAEQVEEGASAG